MTKDNSNIKFLEYEDIIIGVYSMTNHTVILIRNEELDEGVVFHLATKMIKAGCKDFRIQGSLSRRWKEIFDKAKYDINSCDITVKEYINPADVVEELESCKDSVYVIAEYSDIKACHKIVSDAGFGFKVKYIGKDSISLKKDKIYTVLSTKWNQYHIFTEWGEEQLFSPTLFEKCT